MPDTVPQNDFTHLQEGDLVYRSLAGIKMLMRVRTVMDDIVVCDTASGFKGGWMFDRKTGAEEDPDLMWGVKYGATGSYLTNDPVVS